jgi:peptidoglycan/LPS O-acetylase OafA/YrhL
MEKPANHLAYIDHLRGIAVLMVVLVHTSQRVPHLSTIMQSFTQYGQLGVQLFFIASAYTLCLSYDRRRAEPANVRSFYLRRIFRIVPLYYFGALVYFCLYLFSNDPAVKAAEVGTPYTFSHILSNILFIHGLVPGAGNSIVPGGWSIGTEMLFYALFPALFWVCNRMTDLFGIKGILSVWAIAFAVNMIIQVLLRHTWLVMQNNSFMYFSILNQLPVFVTGMTAYILHQRSLMPKILQARSCNIIGFAGFTLITLLLWNAGKSLAFAIIPTTAGLSFACLLGLLRTGHYEWNFLRRIGEISYSIYIFHFLFALHAVPALIRLWLNDRGGEPVLLLSFSLVTLWTVTIATISEKAIEAKGITAGAKAVRSLQTTIKSSQQST